jgi:hypothetical protein
MKWTCAHKPAHMSICRFFEKRFNCDTEHCAMRILDCQVVAARAAYVALEWVMKETERRQVVGIVFLLKRSRCGTGEMLCWKEMSEAMLPEVFDCPERILQLLTATDDPNALKWRQLCRRKQAMLRPARCREMPGPKARLPMRSMS